VDEPEQIGMQMNGIDNWCAVVRGHGIEFKLMFDIPRTVTA